MRNVSGKKVKFSSGTVPGEAIQMQNTNANSKYKYKCKLQIQMHSSIEEWKIGRFYLQLVLGQGEAITKKRENFQYVFTDSCCHQYISGRRKTYR